MQKAIKAVLVLSMLVLRANSQITITQADMPVVGESISTYRDSLGFTTQVISPPGGNQVWNYGGSWAVNSISTTTYVSPNNLSAFSAFPTSNLAVNFISTNVAQQVFYLSTSNSFAILGYKVNSSFVDMLANANNWQISLPITYGQVQPYNSAIVSISSYTIPGFHMRKSIQRKAGINTCDAWGTLTTPAGTAPVLRVKDEVTLDVDSTFIDSTDTGLNFEFSDVTVTNQSDYHYSFYKNGSPFSMMSMDVSIANGTIDLDSYSSIGQLTGIEHASENKLQAYPLPVSNVLNIVNDNLQNTLVRMRDLSGKIVHQCSIMGANLLQINTEGLSNGIYIVEVCDADGSIAKSAKCLVQH